MCIYILNKGPEVMQTTSVLMVQIPLQRNTGYNEEYLHKFFCDLIDMTLVQGHEASLDHCLQICKISSGSKKAVKTYIQPRHYIFDHACTVTLTSEI